MSKRKDVAVSFLQAAASGRVREAYGKHVDKAFKHHNPHFHGTADALMTGMEEMATKRSIADVPPTASEGMREGPPSPAPSGPC